MKLTEFQTMPLSAAEKQKRYRERRNNDPERRAKHRQLQQENYQREEELGIRKPVSDLSKRDKRMKRRYWKEKQRLSRQKRTSETVAVSMTPPKTPVNNVQPEPGSSRQRKQANRKKRRENAKLLRERKLLLIKLREAERKADMYRQRWKRLKKYKGPETPRTKTSKLLRCFSTKGVRKALNFHHVLLAQLRKNCQKRNAQRAIDDLVAGNVMKKYRMTEYMKKEIGINLRRTRVGKPKKGSLSTVLKSKVRQFFERDDNSRITTGKKQTVTRNKIKRQKRLLNDSIRNLHEKFVAETDCEISFTSFWRLKPFWIKPPTEKERDTCICRTCDNIQMKATALNKAKVIDSSDMATVVSGIVCSTDNQTCMYGLCNTCKSNEVQTKQHDENQEIKWQEWTTVKENRAIKRDKETKVKEITITKKVLICSTIKDLREKFQIDIMKYKKHQFNIRNQFKHYRQTKQNLRENECFIHIDFSENYVGKYARETSSMHFGASQPQITLHTGYYIIGSNSINNPFATVSDSMQHGPAAIWALMNPVLQEIKTKYPAVDYIHFYSDGPSTQYRQRNNFFLLTTEIYTLGFKGASWNFHEAGHGKGIPDGRGGAIKRAADRRVLYGADIMNSKELIQELTKSGTKIELFCVEEEAIRKYENNLKQQIIQTVPGTLSIHQTFVNRFGEIQYRDVSCKCLTKTCKMHSLKKFSFEVSNIKKEESTSEQDNEVDPMDTISEEKGQHDKNINSAMTADKAEEKDTKSQLPAEKETLVNDEVDVFKVYIRLLNQCKTFDELKNQCKVFDLSPVEGKPRTILDNELRLDEKAMGLYPSDYDNNVFPVIVRSDGDCLPGCGSVFVYGHDRNGDEMRVRIISELALHTNYYLDEDNLRKGFPSDGSEDSIKKTFAMFSADYIPDTVLTHEIIKQVLEKEIMSISKPRSFMGLWQMFGLASVLQMPIFSVYPILGENFYRKHMHRLIVPRITSTRHTASIMWTSTRDDMVPINWKPNHFVPVLPIEHVSETNDNNNVRSCNTSLGESLQPETDVNIIRVEVITGLDDEDTDQSMNKNIEEQQEYRNKEESSEDIPQNEQPAVVQGVINRKTESDSVDSSAVCNSEIDREDKSNYVGQHVIVAYDGVPYPGIVRDESQDEVFVECMKKVSKSTNKFMWPKRNKDECWYKIEDVLAVIPAPTLIHSSKTQFEIDPLIWQEALCKLDNR